MQVALRAGLPASLWQPLFVVAMSAGQLRVLTFAFVGTPVVGDRPDRKRTPFALRLASEDLVPRAAAAAADSAGSPTNPAVIKVRYTAERAAAGVETIAGHFAEVQEEMFTTTPGGIWWEGAAGEISVRPPPLVQLLPGASSVPAPWPAALGAGASTPTAGPTPRARRPSAAMIAMSEASLPGFDSPQRRPSVLTATPRVAAPPLASARRPSAAMLAMTEAAGRQPSHQLLRFSVFLAEAEQEPQISGRRPSVQAAPRQWALQPCVQQVPLGSARRVSSGYVAPCIFAPDGS